MKEKNKKMYNFSLIYLFFNIEDHKGNVARSIFYFYTMYPTQAGNISQIGDINTFYQWHLADPVDAAEVERNGQIETYQGDRNPYIDHPELIARAWGFTPVNTAPATPTLQFNAGSSSISLSWTNVSNENGYKLYKSTNGSSYSFLSDIAANTTNYTDNSVVENTTYYYYILAYNDYGNSSNSNVVSGQLNSGNTGTGISVSEALATATGTDVTVDGIITESFNGVYALIMKDITGTETIVVKLEADHRDEWSPVNNPGAVGKTIEVVGKRDTYSSQPSIEYVTSIIEIGGTPTDTEAPTAPASLAYSNITTSSVDLSWNASTDNVGVTGYDVYRNSTYLATTINTNYSVSGLTASTSYTFYVKAKDAAGNVSNASNTVNVTTATPADTEVPTVPTSLAYSNVTTSSVDLSWNASTDNVGVTGYDIYRNSIYFATTTNTNYSVTGLTASTTYTFYVKAKDAAGNVSNASSTVSITTSDIILSYCVSQGSNSSYEWISKVAIGNYTKTSGAAGYTDFTSETITLEKGKTVTVQLTPGFSSSSYNEYWKIWVDYNADGDFDDASELAFDAGSLSSTVVSGSITIPSNANGTTRMRVSMKYNGSQTACETFSYGEVEDYTVTFIDAIIDTEAPTVPTALAATNVTTNSATINWNASSDNVGVTGYDVYQDGTYLGSSSTLNYTVTGLSSSTTYSFAVKAKDEAGNASALSNSIAVTTQDAILTYCNSYGNNTNDEWINQVTIANINNTSGDNSGYGDYTHLTANLAAGTSYNITLYTGYSGRAYKEAYSIWIDYNHDGVFDTNTELAFSYSSKVTPVTGSFTVPTSALPGKTRMRISMKYNTASSPCEVFSYGEVEDYTVDITNNSKSETTPMDNNKVVNANFKSKLYPNPASEYTTLELIADDFTEVSYKVIDIQGRIHIEKNNIPVNGFQEEKVDISKLNKGIYFIMIINNDNKITNKLIVE